MILFFKALKNLEAIQVALSNFLITFFALPIAAIWLNEKLGVMAVIGGLLVLISTLSITVWEYRQTTSADLKLNNNKASSTVNNL
jgi:drug/metabolite transporter (DMT)-like permease